MGKNKNSGKQARKVMPPNSNTKVREGAGASGTNVGHSNVRNPSETPRSSSNPTASGTSVGASAKSSPSSSKGSMRPTVSIPAAKSSLPPPPPDPVFVLRSGSTSSVTCVQYISPALRLNELSPSQSEALSAAYGSPDQDGSEASGGGNGPPLLKLPPPGFLLPTTHIAAGLQNGAISVWDLKVIQLVLFIIWIVSVTVIFTMYDSLTLNELAGYFNQRFIFGISSFLSYYINSLKIY